MPKITKVGVFILAMKNRLPIRHPSRIARIKVTIRELKEVVEELDPFLIRLAALAFLLLAIMRMMSVH